MGSGSVFNVGDKVQFIETALGHEGTYTVRAITSQGWIILNEIQGAFHPDWLALVISEEEVISYVKNSNKFKPGDKVKFTYKFLDNNIYTIQKVKGKKVLLKENNALGWFDRESLILVESVNNVWSNALLTDKIPDLKVCFNPKGNSYLKDLYIGYTEEIEKVNIEPLLATLRYHKKVSGSDTI